MYLRCSIPPRLDLPSCVVLERSQNVLVRETYPHLDHQHVDNNLQIRYVVEDLLFFIITFTSQPNS